MLSVKNFNIDSNLNCSLSSSPMSPSSDTSNEENSFQHNLGFGVNESNQHISLMGDGITSFTGTITGNGTSNSGSSGVKRKREKLDHLSEEEKLMRRKLKNRISAQTARDRKKEKLSELECKVNQMSKANCLLLKENVELKKKLDLNKLSELLKHNEQLQAENKQLRERLDALESRINNDSIRVTAQPSVRNISQKSNKIKAESNSESLVTEKSKVNSIESAAFINGSLPKNQERTKEISAIWTKLLVPLLILMGMNAKKSSNGYTDAQSNYWTKISTNCPKTLELKMVDPILMKHLTDYLQLRRNQKREIWNQSGT